VKRHSIPELLAVWLCLTFPLESAVFLSLRWGFLFLEQIRHVVDSPGIACFWSLAKHLKAAPGTDRLGKPSQASSTTLSLADPLRRFFSPNQNTYTACYRTRITLALEYSDPNFPFSSCRDNQAGHTIPLIGRATPVIAKVTPRARCQPSIRPRGFRIEFALGWASRCRSVLDAAYYDYASAGLSLKP